MKTALDKPLEALDQQERSFIDEVRQSGWHATHVMADLDKPNFSYSTGFYVGAQRAEWVIFGLRIETAHDILWNGFRDAHSCQELTSGEKTDSIFASVPAYVFQVDRRHYADHLGWSRWFYGGDTFPCLQIVWSDRDGAFPWESGFDDALRGRQPDLTEHGWQATLAR